MDEQVFHFWSLFFTAILILIQFVGVAVLLWKGGTYVGSVNQIIKQLSINQVEIKSDLEKHMIFDLDSFKSVVSDVSEIKISIARLDGK